MVTLRKLTKKSIIGFGAFQNITVQNLLDLKKHRDLLSIYFKLNRIDFNNEIKEELGIDDMLEIEKPGCLGPYPAACMINSCLSNIIGKMTDKDKLKTIAHFGAEARLDMRINKNNALRLERHFSTKIQNRRHNQW